MPQSDHVQHQQDIATVARLYIDVYSIYSHYIVYSDAQSVFVQLTFIMFTS